MKPASALLAEVIDLLEPPPTMTLNQWAVANRVLSAEESSIPGPYNPEFAAFQIGIMDTISDPSVEKVVVMASTRIGKTFIITNTIGYYADLDPCPILYMRPRDEDAKNFSKQEVQWLFDTTPSLAGKLAENLGKESSNTLNLKQFPGGSLKLIGSNSPAGLSGYAARVALLDEVDRYTVIPGFGNPSELAVGRTTTYPHNKKIVYISSPTIAHNVNAKTKTIHALFLESSQAYFHIACPHCGTRQPLEWERLRFGHCRETLDDVYYQCVSCQGHISEAQKRISIREAAARPDKGWVETFPECPIKGFHISQLYSPFSSFEKIVEEWLLVDKSKDIHSIQRFKNEVLGLPFEEDLGLYKDSSDALYNRRERFTVDVPMGAYLLTMGVDTQDSWLSYTIAGWGVGREAWVIKSGRVEGDPSTPGPWDELAKVIYGEYRHESGVLLGIEKILIDTQGHQTQHVNRFLKGKGPRVQGIYGARTQGKPIITKAKRDGQTGLRKWEIGTDNAKTDLFAMLAVMVEGPLYIHFPYTLDEDYFKELYSERKIGGRFRQIGSRRNEKLDELVYNLAALYICLKNDTIEHRREAVQAQAAELAAPVLAEPDMEEDDAMEEIPEDSALVPEVAAPTPAPSPLTPRPTEAADTDIAHTPPPASAMPLTALDRYKARVAAAKQAMEGPSGNAWDMSIRF